MGNMQALALAIEVRYGRVTLDDALRIHTQGNIHPPLDPELFLPILKQALILASKANDLLKAEDDIGADRILGTLLTFPPADGLGPEDAEQLPVVDVIDAFNIEAFIGVKPIAPGHKIYLVKRRAVYIESFEVEAPSHEAAQAVVDDEDHLPIDLQFEEVVEGTVGHVSVEEAEGANHG